MRREWSRDGPLEHGMSPDMLAFLKESNRIEGIRRPPTDVEVAAHALFLSRPEIRVADLEGFVRDVAARPLREAVGQDVTVGGYRPPRGGPGIRTSLETLLVAAHTFELDPYETHIEYERLHPFLDGNGRSGRVLWAWQMRSEGQDPFALPFLHRFYYQTLSHSGQRAYLEQETRA